MTTLHTAAQAAIPSSQPKDDLPTRLRALVRGFHEWRVENPQDGSYCMSMTRDDSVNPEKDCRDWLENEKRAGGQFAGYVVKHHHVLTAKDKALAEAADALAALAAQPQAPVALTNAQVDRLYANVPPSAQQDARSREAFRRIVRVVEAAHGIPAPQTKEQP